MSRNRSHAMKDWLRLLSYGGPDPSKARSPSLNCRFKERSPFWLTRRSILADRTHTTPPMKIFRSCSLHWLLFTARLKEAYARRCQMPKSQDLLNYWWTSWSSIWYSALYFVASYSLHQIIGFKSPVVPRRRFRVILLTHTPFVHYLQRIHASSKMM